jgi:hypothetical protein
VRLFLCNNVRLIFRDRIFSQNHNQKDDDRGLFFYKEVRPYNQGQSIDILGSNPVGKYLAKQRLCASECVPLKNIYMGNWNSFST